MVCVDNRKKALVVKFENIPSCAVFETHDGQLFYKLTGDYFTAPYADDPADDRANAVNLFTGTLERFDDREEVTVPNAKLVIEQ